MGVPAFYRWISEKYPKIIAEMLERRASVIDGTIVPVDLREPNPNGIEYDNLYVDMNGLIHPCSHPEDREAPKTEQEMYHNVTLYIDRLMAAVRPRRLLYLAIDGVAPRAKMNQQRSRRFRAARDADERKSMMKDVVSEMVDSGLDSSDVSAGEAWDSNVITPGTDFMFNLAIYVRFYIVEKMNKDPFWKGLKVIFSDANEPGEGEHKIMAYIRGQRNQPGYDPNQRHILHGLDADLIMLALATHEAHFSILREKVLFGRAQREAPSKSDAQRMLDMQTVGDISSIRPQDEWVYLKQLEVLHVNVLREYLNYEFACLHQSVPFGYDLERVIDDFIFLCFFVGNDFLPHLPCLDIRDGALDFLIECYKEMLPSLGDYVTSPGGHLNLRQADVILGKVGEMEAQIFAKRKEAEEANERRQEQYKQNNRNRAAAGREGHGRGATASVAAGVTALGKSGGAAPPALLSQVESGVVQAKMDHKYIQMNTSARIDASSPASTSSSAATTISKEANMSAADKIKSLLGKRSAVTTVASLEAEVTAETTSTEAPAPADSVEAARDALLASVAAGVLPESVSMGDLESAAASSVGDTADLDASEIEAIVTDATTALPAGVATSKEVKEEIKRRLKEREQALIDKNKATIVDSVKLHEAGGRERYYNEPFKKKNIEEGGGLKKLCYAYVKGLCWVLKYYYDGCPSWNWYYNFHYAPLASDLINIDMFDGVDKFELAAPFRPVEQLLAVLPSNSVHALPLECHWLMLDASSPIIDLYQGDVPIDPNGQHLPWLWILLLPFIDERRIVEAFQLCQPKLDIYDRRKNALGGSFVYLHSESSLGKEALTKVAYCPGRETDTDVLAALATEKQIMEDGTESSTSVATAVDPAPEEQYSFDATTGDGSSGTLTPPHPAGFVRLNCPVRPGSLAQFYPCRDITQNAVLCFNYHMPPSGQHRSVVLPGVVYQPSILNQQDVVQRRPPKLNKMGFNVLDLYLSLKGRNNQYQQQHQYNDRGGPRREYQLTGQFQERQFSGRSSFGNNNGGGGGYNNYDGGSNSGGYYNNSNSANNNVGYNYGGGAEGGGYSTRPQQQQQYQQGGNYQSSGGNYNTNYNNGGGGGGRSYNQQQQGRPGMDGGYSNAGSYNHNYQQQQGYQNPSSFGGGFNQQFNSNQSGGGYVNSGGYGQLNRRGGDYSQMQQQQQYGGMSLNNNSYGSTSDSGSGHRFNNPASGGTGGGGGGGFSFQNRGYGGGNNNDSTGFTNQSVSQYHNSTVGARQGGMGGGGSMQSMKDQLRQTLQQHQQPQQGQQPQQQGYQFRRPF